MEGPFSLVSIDVEALYTSIPHKWGLNAVWHFLVETYPQAMAQNEFLIDLLEFALTSNVFKFAYKYYQQIRGTSMGAQWAPAYACIHLGLWEKQVVFPSTMYRRHVTAWLRYIDDVLIPWRGTKLEFDEFHKFLNISNRQLSFTSFYSEMDISFLDLLISKTEDTLTTKTYSCKYTIARS